MPNNATSIRIAISKVIIFASDRKIIVPTKPVNEAATPATIFSVLFFGIGYAGSLIHANAAKTARLANECNFALEFEMSAHKPEQLWESMPR